MPAKERARRRALREAEAAKDQAARDRLAARRRRRKALLRRVTPARRRTGRLFARRSRGERAGIVLLTVLFLGLVWLVIDDLALRLVLTALTVIGLPAIVVAVLGRRT
jgi:Flp pilus assembly protein TadB